MKLIAWLCVGLIPLFVHADPQEQLGTLKIESVTLRPQFVLREPGLSDFQIGESLFALRWLMNSRISGVVAVGSGNLLGKAHNYTDQTLDDLRFVEAYAEMVSAYGTVRAGMQPVGFGIEGRTRESDLELQRSLFYQKRLLPLRDIGVSYSIENNDFSTSLLVHNGESDSNVDGRVWYTANWGWAPSQRFQMGAAGSTGTTKPEATDSSNDIIAGVDPLLEAQWRMLGPYIQWTPRNWRVAFEMYGGEMSQRKVVRKFSSGYFALEHDFGGGFAVLSRFDRLDPNHQKDRDTETQVSLGLAWKSERENSRVYLIATKVLEEGQQVANDQIRLIWHLTPYIR